MNTTCLFSTGLGLMGQECFEGLQKNSEILGISGYKGKRPGRAFASFMRNSLKESGNGERCGERKWLDVHHLRPVSQGGGNEAQTGCPVMS
jgi:hypothetical protein